MVAHPCTVTVELYLYGIVTLKEQYPGFTMILRGSKIHLDLTYPSKKKRFYFGKKHSANDNNPLGSEDG